MKRRLVLGTTLVRVTCTACRSRAEFDPERTNVDAEVARHEATCPQRARTKDTAR